MLHELWDDPDDGSHTFVLAGPQGDGARALLSVRARLAWTVEASSHFEAMTLYYEHQGWDAYVSDSPELDSRTYVELGLEQVDRSERESSRRLAELGGVIPMPLQRRVAVESPSHPSRDDCS